MNINHIIARRTDHCLSIFSAGVALLCIVQTSYGEDPARFEINPARLKPEVLCMDFTNPSEARGISLVDKEELANLISTNMAGVTAVKVRDQRLTLLTDPTLIPDRSAVLVALNYYEPDSYGVLGIHGFLESPDNNVGRNSNRYGWQATGCDAWRWRAFIGYADFDLALSWEKAYQPGKQAPLVLEPNILAAYAKEHGKETLLRGILMLPLTEDRLKQVRAFRETVLAMLDDYNSLCVADAGLSAVRARLEQALKMVPENERGVMREEMELLSHAATQGKEETAGQMNEMINLVRVVYDTAYLGFFDNSLPQRQAMITDFQGKARALVRQYNSLAAGIEVGLEKFAKFQREKQGLKPLALPVPSPLAANALVRPKDINSRFFFGLCGEPGYLTLLPRVSVDSVNKDCKIDFVYQYAFNVVPQEDGSFDFTMLDKALPPAQTNKTPRISAVLRNIPLPEWIKNKFFGEEEAQGLRLLVGLHNFPLPPWAMKKFFGDNPERQRQTDGRWCYRIKEGPGKPDTAAYFMDIDTYGFCQGFVQSLAWSDALLQYSADFHRAVGKHLRENPIVIKYNIEAEGGTEMVMEAGYKYDAARSLFQARLKEKFGTIEELNKGFGTTYKDFTDIPLPKPTERMLRLTPEYYEYVQLSIDRLKKSRVTAVQALKEGDPIHPVGEVHSGLYGIHQIDTYKLTVDMPYDTFAAGDSWLSSARYAYSLNRYCPEKPIWLYEPYVMCSIPKGKWSYQLEETARRNMISEVWTWFLWGQQGLPLYTDVRQNSAVCDRRLADIVPYGCYAPWKPQLIYPAIRPASGCMAELKPALDKVLDILKKAPVIARIGLLESSTTHAVPYPVHATYADIRGIQSFLEGNRHFFFVPETAISEGTEKLDQFRIIVSAYATHLRPEVRQKLLDWVKRGGTLIASGPLALYNHYGRKDNNLPKEVFGMDEIAYSPEMITDAAKLVNCSGTMAGCEGQSLWCAKDFFWRFPASGLSSGTRVLASLADGTPVVVERAYGNGKIVMTATPIGLSSKILRPLMEKEIARAIPIPEAQATNYWLTLQVREDAEGARYLGIINKNMKEPVETVVAVAGEFTSVQDLTIGGGLPLASSCGGGVTRIPVWLGPGMVSFLSLGKPQQKLNKLSSEAENATLRVGRFADIVKNAKSSGIDTSGYEKTLATAQQHCARGEYRLAEEELSGVYEKLLRETINARAKTIEERAEKTANPRSATWAASYAEIARALAMEDKADMAQERLVLAENALNENPAPRKPEVVFPFVHGKLDLNDLAKWPEANWQVIYRDREKHDEIGRFLLAGSSNGIYLAAKVKEAVVTDQSQVKDLQWRAMDGVVLHLRCMDRTEKLSPDFRSEDTYEITFYANGSVFVWENPLPDLTRLIENHAAKNEGGYQVAGFIPAEAIRFRPRPGVTVIADVGVCSYDDAAPKKKSETFYWHGTYAQAETWARVQLGNIVQGVPAKASVAAGAPSEKNVAEICRDTEHWLAHETRGVGKALADFDPSAVLPNGKKGAIVLTRPNDEEKAQLSVRFSAIGKKRGLRVWLKGTNSNGFVDLRVTGREGYTWAMRVKDDSSDWRRIYVDLDSCERTREDQYAELLNGETAYRPNLNTLVVRLTQPAARIQVGLIEWLESPGIAQEAEVVLKQDFEAGAAGWRFAPGSTGNVNIISDDQAHTGKYSNKMVCKDSAEHIYTQKILAGSTKLVPGKYRLTYWLKTDLAPSGGKGAYLIIEIVDKDNHSVKSGMNPGKRIMGELDWTRFELVFTVGGEAETARIYPMLYKTTGTAWFDDIVLTRISDSEVREQ